MNSTHDYHPDLDGYDEEHVLQDGCEECERRSKDGLNGLLHLDAQNLATIWDRMRDRKRESYRVPASHCDLRLMNTAEEVETLNERLLIAGVD